MSRIDEKAALEMFASLLEQGPTDGANSDRVKYPDASKFKDANRPPGWYTVKVGGKDVARYWPGGKDYQGAGKDKGTGWKVNGPNPNAPIGMGTANDPRAQDIRQGEWDARNQGLVQGTVDNLGTAAAGSLAVPMTTWSGLTTGAQNAWNRASNAYQGIGAVRANGTGQFVTPGEQYPSQQGGKWGYTIYDKNGKPKWQEDARATPIGDRVQGIKDFVTGTDRNIPVVPGLTGPDGVLTPLIPGGGQPEGGGEQPEAGQTEPQVQVAPPAKPEDEVTQDGPNAAGLTPMQQWAKRFPKLAARVKPGQAGYDEIQKMNSGSQQQQSRQLPAVSGYTPDGKPIQTADVQARNQQAGATPPQPAAQQQSPQQDVQSALRQAVERRREAQQQQSMTRTPKTSQATGNQIKPIGNTPKLDKALSGVKRLPGLPEEFDLDKVLDAMCEGLPEPKRNYLKDMDPYDPRRSPRDHAPGAPLPPPSLRPGLPPMKLAKKKGNKDTKKA